MKHAATDVVGMRKIAHLVGRSYDVTRRWPDRFDDWPAPRGYVSMATSGPGSMPWWDYSIDVVPFMDRHPDLYGAEVNR